MRRLFGVLLQVAGWLGLAWSAMVGLSFSGVYLMGYIGTRGNEAGKELVFMLGATVVALLVCWLVIRAGRALAPPLPKPSTPDTRA